jgi:endonuclease YncB( thermonuclease family)
LKFILYLLCICGPSLLAHDEITLEGSAVEVVSVYDGDTFKINIPGVPAVFGKKISIRIKGIDTPEIRGGTEATKAKARASREYLRSLLSGNLVTIHNVERGKYFRILADVKAGGVNIADNMINAGHGKKYNGGKR